MCGIEFLAQNPSLDVMVRARQCYDVHVCDGVECGCPVYAGERFKPASPCAGEERLTSELAVPNA